MLFNVFNEQITTFENIPPLRREVVVHGDGNCGHIIGCASLLKGPICITHRHRRKGSVLSRLLTLIRSHSSQQRSSVSDSVL